ncbi:MAG: DUF3152 domain-containing protein [Nocardioides sp.]
MNRVVVVLAGLLLALLAPVAVAAEPVTNLTPPTADGTVVYRSRLVAGPGTWSATAPTYTYQWLRDGREITGATGSAYRLRLEDIGTDVAVKVTATEDGPGGSQSGSAVSAGHRVRRATLVLEKRPEISGTRRYLHQLEASVPRWRQHVDRVRYQWLRDGAAIHGATGRRHTAGHRDVGHRLTVRASAVRRGFRNAVTASTRTTPVGHRVPLRRTVRYHVETRGRIVSSLADFRRLAHASLNDPRGWRVTGIAFKEVRSGGSMTLVLAEASRVPTFSSACSSSWSCRVGRYVVINQERWRFASPAWNRYGGSLRGYRHMVVNHESGHWLGHGHRSCPARGGLAPVMQQQSISLGGCRFNPFPTKREWFTPRF